MRCSPESRQRASWSNTTYERDQNGSDEAMFRRYNRRHARFDQPDPYDGSFHLADPQSFNRYPYVTNDLVNFTDPTGLWSLEGGGVDPTKRVMAGGWLFAIGRGGLMVYRVATSFENHPSLHWEVWALLSGGFGGPQDGPGARGPGQVSNHCAFLADYAEALAKNTDDDSEFVGKLSMRFQVPEPAADHHDLYSEFNALGFKDEFAERPMDGGSPNQVNHYAGIFTNAFKAGEAAKLALMPSKLAIAAALKAANRRESADTPDSRMNTFAVSHAIRLSYGLIQRGDIAKLIRSELCK